jgi:hypothetical protein
MMSLRSTIAAVLLFLSCAAFAQDNQAVLGPGNRALRVELPQEAFAQEGAALSVDLDGYDVSQFSRLDGATLEVNLATPLSAGRHSLSILLFLPDGGIDVLLNTTVDAPEIQGVQAALNTTLQTTYRADQRPDKHFQGVDRTTNIGSVSFEGKSASGRWRLASGVDAIYDRYNDATPAGESWLLPAYSLSVANLGDNAETSAGAGNIKVGRDDLLFARYTRRGASMQTAATSGRFALQMFSVASTPRNSFDGDYLGATDVDDRTRGVAASLNLVQDHLEISSGFVDGRSAYGGAGFNMNDDALVYGGESWNVAVDSRWLKGGLWLRFEHAASEFDSDGLGVGAAARKDDATLARLRLSSMGRLGAGPFRYWSVDLAHKRVGSDFYSLGNLSQPGNLGVSSVHLHGGFNSMAVGMQLSEQRTNPDDDPLRPRQTLKRIGLDVSYTPAMLDPENRLWRSIGAPSLSGWLYRSASSQPQDDALVAGFDLDNTTDEVGLTLAFAREKFSWSVELALVDFDDRSEAVIDGGYLIYEPLSDSRNVLSTLQASWAPAARLVLNAYVQRNSLDEHDYGDEHRTTNYGASGTFFLAPEKLSLHVSASQGRERHRYGDPQFWPDRLRSRFASTQLNWLLAEAGGGRPAFSMYFKGAYARNEDLSFVLDDEIWSVYVGVALSWKGSKQ